MENEKIYKMMDEIITYIPTIFSEEKKLRKHLSCMRYWADMEWFNLLSILYQYPNATNVRTTTAWSKSLNKELFPKRGERGIQIFLPIYKVNMIEWKIVKVFDISQMQTFIKPKYTSYLQMVINDIHDNHLHNKEEGWQKQLLLNTMKSLSSFKELSKDEIKFTLDCVYVSCGDLLWISLDTINGIKLNTPPTEDYTRLYKFIKDTIAGLPEELVKYVEVLDAREKSKKEIAEALRITKMNIKENISEAKIIANNRLQVITDSDNQIAIEDETNIGIPLDEIIQEDDIFKGEI